MEEDIEKTSNSFRLQPFTHTPVLDTISFSGSLNRAPGKLLVEYTLHGPLQDIKLSPSHPAPGRCHELWRHTCFELFFGVKSDPGYWECNYCLGDYWNVYRFDGYRIGMREDHRFEQPLSTNTQGPEHLSLSCELPLSGIVEDSCELEAGVCCVIETTDGNTQHWAIKHHEPTPDFHNRYGFLLLLPGIV